MLKRASDPLSFIFNHKVEPVVEESNDFLSKSIFKGDPMNMFSFMNMEETEEAFEETPFSIKVASADPMEFLSLFNLEDVVQSIAEKVPTMEEEGMPFNLFSFMSV
jgi:hypothetical protein